MACCDSAQLTSLPDALKQILADIVPSVALEQVPIESALNRICAAPIHSPMCIPPFDNSAMDGYALCASDLDQSLCLPVTQTIMAGSLVTPSLTRGSCARIMTGAPMPLGADTVVMQEAISQIDDQISFPENIRPGQNVRLKGEDVQQQQSVLTAGTRITSRHIGLLSSLGIATVAVIKKLKIALISTGDELVAPGKPLQAGQIYDSNRLAVKALFMPLAVDIIDFGIIPDELATFRKYFSQADQAADIVICSGGVSVGDADYTKQVLDELGQVSFWKLAIKPGKPFAFGKLPNSFFIGLPGNPVSAFITAYKLALPIIAKSLAWDLPEPPLQTAICRQAIKKRPGRTDFQRGIATVNAQGQLEVSLTGKQGSAIFTSLCQANCFVVLEQARGNISAGEPVKIEWFTYPLL